MAIRFDVDRHCFLKAEKFSVIVSTGSRSSIVGGPGEPDLLNRGKEWLKDQISRKLTWISFGPG